MKAIATATLSLASLASQTETPARFWHDPRVKSAASRKAPYRGAANGNVGEHDIATPERRE